MKRDDAALAMVEAALRSREYLGHERRLELAEILLRVRLTRRPWRRWVWWWRG